MSRRRTRRDLILAGASLGTLALAGCLGGPGGDEWVFEGTLPVASAHQYSAPGCGCCGAYADYLRESLEVELSESTPDDVAASKREHGVPRDLRSCHTLVLDDYVVEGHVPVEVIARLFEEAPDIDGIALPGMPAGSPGMSGMKQGTFVFYVLGGSRTGEVFTEL